MSSRSPNRTLDYARPLAAPRDLGRLLPWLFMGYILLIPIAEGVLHYNHTITHDRARFHVINALTLTGFQSSKPISAFPPHAQLTILALTILGILFPLVVGGLCTVRILKLPCSDWQIIRFALASAALLVIVGTIPLIGIGRRSPVNALMLSASSFGNSGVSFGPDPEAPVQNAADALPSLLSWQTHFVVLPLAFLGSVGLPVLLDLAGFIRRGAPLSFHSRIVLSFSAGLYLVCLVVFLVTRYLWDYESLKFENLHDFMAFVASGSTAAVNSRTLGLPYEYAQDYPPILQWMLIVPMLIGGSPASTAGGLKTTTVFELYRGTRRCLRGENPGPAFGIAVAWTGIYLAIAAGFFLLLVACTPSLRPDRLAFETVSAVSNVGLSFYHVQIVTPSLDLLSGAMLFGRLTPLMILWWQARVAPGGDVAIG